MPYLYSFEDFSFRDDAHLREPERLRRLRPVKNIARAVAVLSSMFGLGAIALGIYMLPAELLPPRPAATHWVDVFSYGLFILIGANFVYFGLAHLLRNRRTLVDEYLAGAGDCVFAEGALVRIAGRHKVAQNKWTLTVEGTFSGVGAFSVNFDEGLWKASIADPESPRPGDDKRLRPPIPCRVIYRNSLPERGELAGIPAETVARLKLAAE